MIGKCLAEAVKISFKILTKPIVGIFKSDTLFDNSHYKVTSLASHHLADIIKIRYNTFRMSLVPQILGHIKRKHNEVEVVFINLIGSASLYQQYEDIDINSISEEDYVRFIFSKPVLLGRAPELYSSKIVNLLCYAIKEALDKFDKAPNERKAMHLLAAAFRHIYSVCRLGKRKFPVWFMSSIRTLYLMENNQWYDRNKLLIMRNLVDSYKDFPDY